ncbi:MAG: hypothetical protein K0R82_1474 [Flavipsychrobacter sp.]|jgi:hypothetical protein|nr:hypothetical protein [Flavipsychrobacter sp.]
MRSLIVLVLVLLSCNRDPDKTPIPAPAPVDGRDSIIGTYNGQLRIWHTYPKFDSVKNQTYLVTQVDSLYTTTCVVAKTGKDSFTINIEPANWLESCQYIPGQRHYRIPIGSPVHGGTNIDIFKDSIDYRTSYTGSYSSFTKGKDFLGRK